MIKTKARLINVTSIKGCWLHLIFLATLIPFESAIAQPLTTESSILEESLDSRLTLKRGEGVSFSNRSAAKELLPIHPRQGQDFFIAPSENLGSTTAVDKAEGLAQLETEAEAVEEEDGNQWEFEIQPTILLPLNVSGEVTVEGLIQLDRDDLAESIGGFVDQVTLPENVDLSQFDDVDIDAVLNELAIQSVTFDLDLEDILNLERALRLSGRVQAWKGNFGLIFDGQYSRVEEEGGFTIGPLEVMDGEGNVRRSEAAEFDTNLQVEQAFFDFAATYHFGDEIVRRQAADVPEEEIDFPLFFVEPIAGVRLAFLSQDTEIDPGPEFGFDSTYIEPLIGARLGLQVSPRIILGLRGDVSGFGIGSDVTWNFLAGLDWRFSRNTSLRAAYRFNELNYDTEENDREFDLNVQEQGIWLGLSFYL